MQDKEPRNDILQDPQKRIAAEKSAAVAADPRSEAVAETAGDDVLNDVDRSAVDLVKEVPDKEGTDMIKPIEIKDLKGRSFRHRRRLLRRACEDARACC